jgi:hypothetical protein
MGQSHWDLSIMEQFIWAGYESFNTLGLSFGTVSMTWSRSTFVCLGNMVSGYLTRCCTTAPEAIRFPAAAGIVTGIDAMQAVMNITEIYWCR